MVQIDVTRYLGEDRGEIVEAFDIAIREDQKIVKTIKTLNALRAISDLVESDRSLVNASVVFYPERRDPVGIRRTSVPKYLTGAVRPAWDRR